MTPVLVRTSARRITPSLLFYISITRLRFQSRRDKAGSQIKTKSPTAIGCVRWHHLERPVNVDKYSWIQRFQKWSRNRREIHHCFFIKMGSCSVVPTGVCAAFGQPSKIWMGVRGSSSSWLNGKCVKGRELAICSAAIRKLYSVSSRGPGTFKVDCNTRLTFPYTTFCRIMWTIKLPVNTFRRQFIWTFSQLDQRQQSFYHCRV